MIKNENEENEKVVRKADENSILREQQGQGRRRFQKGEIKKCERCER